jgi:HD-like signal output (HDOD) protein
MESRLTRIEDCIADLGVSACLEAVSAETIGHNHRYEAVAEIWAHSREIAHCARLVAEDTADVNPDEAYLVGLLHNIGLLPNALGWNGSGRPVDGTLAGLQLARQWSFPNAAVEYFQESQQRDGCPAPWTEIVHKAHRLANRSSVHCPLEQEMRPQLYRAV